MARILLGSMPFVSHVSPMLPVARKLVERGHDVRWYTGRLFQAQVEATGARYLPVKHAPDFNEREWEESCPQLKGLHGLARFKMAMKDICPAAGPAQANDLEEILEEWPADIMVSEPTFAGAARVSHARGIPWAALGIGPLTLDSRDTAPFGLGLPPAPGLMGRLRNKALYALASKLALADVVEAADEVRPVAGMPFVESVIQHTLSPYLYLQGTTGAFEYPRADLPPQVHFVGPLLPSPQEEFTPPAWWHELEGNRPVVLVTEGMVSDERFEDLVVPALRTLAQEDVLVVITTGGKSGSVNMDLLPENVRVETSIPYNKLMRYVSVALTNGSYGEVQTALANGVPLVVVGRNEDKSEVGARVRWSGVGIDLKKRKPSVKQVKAAVLEVLEDPTYWCKVQEVAADFKRHDPQTEVAVLLEKLAQTRRPVLRAPKPGTNTHARPQPRVVDGPAALSPLTAAGECSE